MEELESQGHSVLEVLEGPVIEDMDQKSMIHRVDKAANKAGQSDFFGQFDLFNKDIALNLSGQDSYKTEFGGIVYLLIMVATITLTVIYVFPNGLKINTKITDYSLLQDTNGKGVSIFGPSNYLMRLFLYDKANSANCKGDQLKFFLRSLEAYQVINDTAAGITSVTPIDLHADYETGNFYIYNTGANSGLQLYNDSTGNATIRIEPLYCDMYVDYDDTYGECFNIYFMFLGVQVPSYNKMTGDLEQKSVKVPVGQYPNVVLGMDVAHYSTNNLVLGYIANIFSYQINYFEPWTMMYPDLRFSQYDPPQVYGSSKQKCLEYFYNYGSNFQCLYFDIAYSGTTTYAMEEFDNIIQPLLFFIAVSQTLLYFVSIAFLKNYANNCLYLAAADKLVYIADPQGHHYNFKKGAILFFVCLWHRHILVEMLDYVLYRFWETQSKNWMSLRAQAAMTMIDFGAESMTDNSIYGELNDLYAQENTQPSKIIFDYDADPEVKKKEIEDEINEQEPDRYFEDDIREQAFRRLCNQHDIYSTKRRTYFRDLLLETDKKYKLVLQAQEVFEGYCTQVRNEGFSKEIEIPLAFQNEEISGHNLKKDNFY